MRRLAVPFLVTASMSAPAGAQPKPAPLPTANPPGPVKPARPSAPPSSVAVPNGRIVRSASGQCRMIYQARCPVGARCNPPRPRAVPCPPALLPTARPGEQIIRKSDGTCAGFTPMDCPPQTRCNPPPPRPIRCPDAPQAPASAAPASTRFAPPPGE